MESEYPTKTYDNSSSDAEEEGPEDENIDDSVVDDDHDGKMQVDALLDFDANFSDASFSKSCCDQWHHPEHMKRGGNIGAASLIQSRLSHPKARIHICKIHSRLPCCCSSCGSLALATVVCSLSYFWGDKFGLFFARGPCNLGENMLTQFFEGRIPGKSRPSREILDQRKGRGQDGVDKC